MRNPFDLESHTTIPHDGSYIASYPHLLSYFSEGGTFTDADVVRGAHMVYGWMPTILDINPGSPPRTDLQQAADYLTKARHEPLTHTELSALKRPVNNSMVGASKLLHFVAPQRHAVSDSKVFALFRPLWLRVRSQQRAPLRDLSGRVERIDDRPPFCRLPRVGLHEGRVSRSGLRALELVMFLNAPERKRKGQIASSEARRLQPQNIP